MRPRISITGSIRPSVRRSVRRYVGPLVRLLLKTREINIFDHIVKKNHVITSSYNHFIIMRTHRWPYGPCYHLLLLFKPLICYLYIFVYIELIYYLDLGLFIFHRNDAVWCLIKFVGDVGNVD